MDLSARDRGRDRCDIREDVLLNNTENYEGDITQQMSILQGED